MFRLTEAGIWARKLGQKVLDGVDHLDGVGAGLALDGQDDGRPVVEPGGDLVVLDAVDDLAQILQAHRRAVAVGHDERPVGLGAA